MAEDLSHRIQDLEERNRRLEETLRQMRLDWEIISASAFADSAQYDEGVGTGGTPLWTGSLDGDEEKPGGEIDLSVLDSHIADGTEKKLVGKSLDYQASDPDVAPALELHGFSAVGAPGAPTPPQFVFGEKEEGADNTDGSPPMGLLDPDGKSTSDPKSKWLFAVRAPTDGTSPPELRWVKINLDDLPAQDVEIVGGNKIDVTRDGDTWTISYNPDKPDEGGGEGGGEDEPAEEPPPCGNPLNGPETDPTPEPEGHTAIEDSDPPLDESADPTPGDGGKTDNPLDHPGDGGYTPACGGEPT